MYTIGPEEQEQYSLVQWLDLKGLVFTAIPNETHTKSITQKMRNKRKGVRAGFPDLVILVQPNQSKDEQGYLLLVELKRPDGKGRLSPTQKEWEKNIQALNSKNVKHKVANGWQEAADFISGYLTR